MLENVSIFFSVLYDSLTGQPVAAESQRFQLAEIPQRLGNRPCRKNNRVFNFVKLLDLLEHGAHLLTYSWVE